MSVSYMLLLILSLFINSVTSNRGEDLADLVNSYRRSRGLSSIPYSNSLMKVAKRHCEVSCRVGSLSNRECWNPHSWDEIPGYSQYDYDTCCYSPFTGSSMYCMWDKPKEIADWDVNGFEITAGSYGTRALDAWKKSSGHDDVILQKNKWKYSEWKAIGCASTGYTSHCWFASETDNDRYRAQSEPSCPSGGDDDDDDEISQPSCVSISGAGSMSGTYRKSGTYDGYPAYDGPNGYWLYVGDTWNVITYWMISDEKGYKTYSNGYCTEADLLDCDREFRGGSGSSIRLSSCGGRLEIDDINEDGSEANGAKNKVNMWLFVALSLILVICSISLCLYMKKKKRRETQGIKVHDAEVLENDEEEEEEEDGVVIKFVGDEDGGETTKTVN